MEPLPPFWLKCAKACGAGGELSGLEQSTHNRSTIGDPVKEGSQPGDITRTYANRLPSHRQPPSGRRTLLSDGHTEAGACTPCTRSDIDP